MARLIGWIVILALVGVAGYFGYRYFVVEHPAGWLIKLVTNTDPPPPLPTGDAAPLTAPEGFTATIFARDVKGARVMVRDQKGTMLVSQTSEGKVVALPDLDANGVADNTVTILSGLRQPHGLLMHCVEQNTCTLYVAETNALKSYSYDADTRSATNPKTLTTFPSGDGHFTRTLMMHPDGKRILISVGSSCNVCNEDNAMRATIQQFDIATNKISVFASGLRNSVFMATDPVHGAVWATENGRDLIGDDIPPDEVNIIEEGKNYGWPSCYGNNVRDTDFDASDYAIYPCRVQITTPAHLELQAHSAALGLAFVPEEGWPEEMALDLLVAYHGSWNRSSPTGYKVVRFDLSQTASRAAMGGPFDFLTGFLPAGASDTDDAIGRPVDLMIEPGGTLYVSDDRAGAIYRVTLNEPAY